MWVEIFAYPVDDGSDVCKKIWEGVLEVIPREGEKISPHVVNTDDDDEPIPTLIVDEVVHLINAGTVAIYTEKDEDNIFPEIPDIKDVTLT